MNYIFEAIIVGLYDVILYFIFSQIISNFYTLLLVVGFSKHFLGNVLGLQRWYCNKGAACLHVLSRKQKYIANANYLLLISIGEAIMHLILGILLSNFLSKAYLFFAIGFILHIGAELLGIHNKFCKDFCKKSD